MKERLATVSLARFFFCEPLHPDHSVPLHDERAKIMKERISIVSPAILSFFWPLHPDHCAPVHYERVTAAPEESCMRLLKEARHPVCPRVVEPLLMPETLSFHTDLFLPLVSKQKQSH